jgi:hypothetical protein
MTGKVAKDAVVVPTAAVFKSPEGADYVLVAGADEKAHQRKVQLGIRNNDLAQIVSGVNPGDPVITAGGYAVPDRTKIKIEQPDASAKEGADDADPGAKGDTKGAADQKKNEKGGTKAAGKGKE